jgi:hypothetical protein
MTVSAYRWEYITNLDFEWEIYTGQRHWRWSFVVYLSARILALASLITLLVGFDITTPYNCDVRMLFSLTTGIFCVSSNPLSTSIGLVQNNACSYLSRNPGRCSS